MVALRCDAATHLKMSPGGQYISVRCTETKRCPEAREAKERGERAYHVWNTQTWEMWTEYEPVKAGKEQ